MKGLRIFLTGKMKERQEENETWKENLNIKKLNSIAKIKPANELILNQTKLDLENDNPKFNNESEKINKSSNFNNTHATVMGFSSKDFEGKSLEKLLSFLELECDMCFKTAAGLLLWQGISFLMNKDLLSLNEFMFGVGFMGLLGVGIFSLVNLPDLILYSYLKVKDSKLELFKNADNTKTKRAKKKKMDKQS